jgi:hypothetical protein
MCLLRVAYWYELTFRGWKSSKIPNVYLPSLALHCNLLEKSPSIINCLTDNHREKHTRAHFIVFSWTSSFRSEGLCWFILAYWTNLLVLTRTNQSNIENCLLCTVMCYKPHTIFRLFKIYLAVDAVNDLPAIKSWFTPVHKLLYAVTSSLLNNNRLKL